MVEVTEQEQNSEKKEYYERQNNTTKFKTSWGYNIRE